MEKILFVVLFITIVAGIYSVYSKKDKGTHENETESKVQKCEEEKTIEIPKNEEETPTSTGGD
jgi:cbb3-type cytochrome oxidase subunit 3